MRAIKIISFLLLSFLVIGFGNDSYADPKADSALVIIDVQKAFSEEGGFSPVCREQADSMLPVINKLAQQFWDHNNHIIYIKQEYVRDTEFDGRLKILSNAQFTKKYPSSFSSKGFEKYLQSQNIKNLYIVGLAAEYCVSATVSEALKRGFEVSVVDDGLAAKVCTSLKDELKAYKEQGAHVVHSTDI